MATGQENSVDDKQIRRLVLQTYKAKHISKDYLWGTMTDAPIDIPLLREAIAYARRLEIAVKKYGESRYFFLRRLNWSHRFGDDFYQKEVCWFLEDSDGYIAGNCVEDTEITDVFLQKVSAKIVRATLLKVAVHWFFVILGRTPRSPIYRKCYVDVDDVAPLSHPIAADVVRAVYPFPLSLKRQWKYLRSLRRRKIKYVLAGNPYLLKDVIHFAQRRDLRSMMRLESRAQILLARRLSGFGVKRVEMSDEFNLGSLDFCRAIARNNVEVVNSAHGVGKYLPAHAYGEFNLLTNKQKEYYITAGTCRYTVRDQKPINNNQLSGKINLVYLSQTFSGLEGLVRKFENQAVSILSATNFDHDKIDLYFKPHPTQGNSPPPDGFEILNDVSQVNGKPGTVFVSQFSSCQVDPNFQGRKILLRSPLIHPEIVFDDTEEIMTLDDLIQMVKAYE